MPLTVRVTASVAAEGYTRHRLEIAVSEIARLPAYLLVPDGLSPGERRPGLIACQGHHAHGMDQVAGATEPDAPNAYGHAAAQDMVGLARPRRTPALC